MLRNTVKLLLFVLGFLIKSLISKPERIAEPHQIAILLWGGIGNYVLFSPVLYGIREKFPQAHLTICSFHSFAKCLFSKTANSFITINSLPSFATIRKMIFLMRRLHPDIVISNTMSPTFLTSFIAFLSGAKVRVGMNRANRGFLNNIRLIERGKHEVLENALIAKSISVDAEKFSLSVDWTEEDRRIAERIFKDLFKNSNRPVIAIQPGSGKRQSFKRWDVEKFKEVAEGLLKRNMKVVVVGTEEERDEMKYLEKYINNSNFKVLRKKLTLPQMTLFLDNCNLLIANDTSLVHLSSVVRTPSIVIYGPTNPEKNSPWKVKFRIVRKNLPCSPCYNFRTPKCPYNFSCLGEITVEEVLDAALDLLDTGKEAIPSSIPL